MAILRKFRLSFLWAPALLLGLPGLGAAAASARSQSWFDRQLDLKSNLLLQQIHAHDERSSLIAVALLDEISELREQVADPERIDGLVRQIANDVEASAALQEEAKAVLHSNAPNDDPAGRERARALLSWAESHSQSDPEVVDAAAAIKLHHHLLNFAEAQRLAELARTAESWNRAALAAADDSHRAEAERRAIELDPNYMPSLIDLARQYSARGEITRARSLLAKALVQQPHEPSLLTLLAQLDINQGRVSVALASMRELRSEALSPAVARALAVSYSQIGFTKQALELSQKAARLSPGRPGSSELAQEVPLQGSKTDVETEDGGSDVDVSQDAMESSVETAPAQSVEGERLRRILHGYPATTEVTDDYFVKVSDLIAKWRALPLSRRAESRVLANVRVDDLRADYQVVQHTQLLVALASQPDVEANRNRTIQYSPQSQQLTVLRARVHHAAGRVVDAEDDGEAPVADASVAAYYDLRAKQLRFRDLTPGDVIELDYVIAPTTPANPYGNYFAELVAFGGPLSCSLQRYVLRAPTAVNLSRAQHYLAAAQVRRVGNESTYIWERRAIAGLSREPRSPSWSEQGAYVHVSNFATWEALGKWYADLAAPQFDLNPEMESAVAEIVARHPNRLDRVDAIDDLVLRSTRYVALEFGIYGFKPYPVAQTFSRKFGDCKDKASLMVALLRAAGIDAQIALLRTQHLGEILPQPASASVFDHAIVYVPEFDLWLDGTAEFARLRELPVEDQGVMALTVDLDGKAVLRRTPRSTADDNYSRRTINATLDGDGTIHFSGATYVRGEDAPELRRQLEVRDAKLGYVRERLAQVLPAVEIHNVEAPVGSAEAVSLSFSGDLVAYRGHRNASLPSSWMERNYLSTLAPGASRTQDLLLDAPWTTEEEVHIQLPAGARVASLPESQTIVTDFGSARIEYEVHGRDVTVLSNVQFVTTRIPARQFSAFRDFTGKLESTFHRNIEVELP
jgi:cellulose synthase operon protein C